MLSLGPRVDSVEPSDTLVSLHSVGVRRGGRWLVRDVSLHVGRGEIVTLIGPNGSGKSTVVRAALGLIGVDEGHVASAPNLTVGYVPQDLGLDSTLPLTVERMMRLTGRPSRRAIREALEATGASHLADAQVNDLSGGERQRVLLARAIARSPDLLVLDEPVQGVDASGEVRLYELIDRIRHGFGCGVLLISHDLHVVMARTDRVVCMNGHVCCEGTPEAVFASDDYRALFGPVDGGLRTHAIYHHHHDHSHDHAPHHTLDRDHANGEVHS